MDTGDNELIKCVKEGDLKAFEKVFKDYYALMCSVAMDYVNDSAMCQTLTEDVLLNLWEKEKRTGDYNFFACLSFTCRAQQMYRPSQDAASEFGFFRVL